MAAGLTTDTRGAASVWKLSIGFVAGFLAVLCFHQPGLYVLNSIGFVHATTYSMQHAMPFGVPQVLSLSFWGGVWGVLFTLIEGRFPRGVPYWVYAIVFGAVFPTLVAWFVVSPLKGLPVAGGWEARWMITGLLINGAWGLGTALLLVLGLARQGAQAPAANGERRAHRAPPRT